MLSKVEYSLANVPAGLRARCLQDEAATQLQMSVSNTVQSRDTLHAEFKGYRTEKLRFVEIRLSPHVGVQRPRQALQRPGFMISQILEGDCSVSQGEREAKVSSGTFFAIDTSMPYRWETGWISARSVFLSSAVMRKAASDIDTLTALALPSGGGTVRFLKAFFDELYETAPSLGDAAVDPLADVLAQVYGVAARSTISPCDRDVGKIRQFHRRRIRQFVQNHLDDPELSADKIAHGVNVSRRYLYEVLGSEAGTLMRDVWAARLERCRLELEDQRLTHTSISEIGYRWGYTAMSHFSRAFRTAYGKSPREYRQSFANGAVVTDS